MAMDLSAFSYQKFVHFALQEAQLRTTLTPLPSQEKFKKIKAQDDRTSLHALSFQASKIRLLRSLSIEGSPTMQAWFDLMDQAVEEKNLSSILQNQEAQHKYLTWRAEKDPGHPILKRLIGEYLARDMVRQFLFEGVDSLGDKSFLDYFPEYRCEDGTINQKRSMIGKSYAARPWDANGEFIGNDLT